MIREISIRFPTLKNRLFSRVDSTNRCHLAQLSRDFLATMTDFLRRSSRPAHRLARAVTSVLTSHPCLLQDKKRAVQIYLAPGRCEIDRSIISLTCLKADDLFSKHGPRHHGVNLLAGKHLNSLFPELISSMNHSFSSKVIHFISAET